MGVSEVVAAADFAERRRRFKQPRATPPAVAENVAAPALADVPLFVEIAALAALYYAGARLGLVAPSLPGGVTAVWPSTGIAVAVLYLRGTRLWAGVALGSLLVGSTGSLAVVSSIGVTVGNTLGAVVGAGLLRRVVQFGPALRRTRDVVVLAAIAGVVATATATIVVASMAAGGDLARHDWTRTWLVAWVGRVGGVIIVTPVILVWVSRWERRSRLRSSASMVAGVVACGGLGVAWALSFSRHEGQPYLIFPFLIWIAVRLGPRGAATANAAVGTVAVILTAHGYGPITRPDTVDSLRMLGLYLASAAITSLVLAAAVSERDRAEDLLVENARLLEHRVAERTVALEREHRRLEEAQEVARVGSWEWDVVADRSMWSDQLYRIFGLERTEAPLNYDRYFELVHPDDRDMVHAVVTHTFNTLEPCVVDHRVTTMTGEERWLRCRGRVTATAAGVPTRMSGTAQDITDEKTAAAELRASEERYRTIVETAQEGIWVVDGDGLTTFVNQKLADMLGYTTEELVGQPLRRFLDDDALAVEQKHLDLRRHGAAVQYENRLCTSAGHDLWVLVSASPTFAADGSYAGSLAMLADITDRKQLEARLVHQATHDSLTGLPNRVLFHDRIEHALDRAQRNLDDVAVLVIDLDGFKEINDTYGHDVGDQVLVSVADRLVDSVRRPDTVARLGGDEFVVLCEELDGMEEAQAVSRRVVRALSVPVMVGETSVGIGASVGIAMAHEGCDTTHLLQAADAAMYESKTRRSERNRGTIYSIR